MAKKVVKKEIESWLESDVETALIELKDVTDDKALFCVGEEEQKFSISFPKDYPKSKEKLVINSDDEQLAEWKKQMNIVASKSNIKFGDFLTQAAEKFLELGEDDEEEDEDQFEDDDLGLDTKVEKEVKPKKSKEEEEVDNRNFLEIGSPTATMRLIRDLKTIQKGDPKQLGFSASPAIDKPTGMENLYNWEIKLFGFDKDCELYKDMETFKKKTGQDYILMELRFSKDYPFAPPFVRVVRPRFAFRTGHVTIGGSICMELLTNSGWNSTNDIESILIQIRAEMTGGGARLDAGMSNTYEYTEQEAWDAFFRAASTHGWSTNGLNRNNYDLTKK